MDTLEEYRRELDGIVPLPGRMEKTILTFARSVRVHIEAEQRKPNPDNALIALLCDAARLGDEHLVLFGLVPGERRSMKPRR